MLVTIRARGHVSDTEYSTLDTQLLAYLAVIHVSAYYCMRPHTNTSDTQLFADLAVLQPD